MKINRYIDHTLLKADATKEDIENLCDEAINYNFASVCVNGCYTKMVYEKLKDYEDIKVCTVVGFPLGAMTTETKIFEAKNAVSNGSDEIDMVINIGALKDRDYEYVENEIFKVKEAIGNKKILKVIVETCLLSDEEKEIACEIVKNGYGDYIKTSTGFSKSGAEIKDIQLMKKILNGKVKIKASGGISDLKSAEEFIKAGADRLGLSKSVIIVNEKN